MSNKVSQTPKPTGPRTVADGFSEFLEKLVSKKTDNDVADANMGIIESCLGTDLDLSYLAPYGSTGYGTNISHYSAVDCIAVIPKSRLFENSGESLAAMKKALEQKFPDAYITEGRPVLAIPFGKTSSERHHIVPAYRQGSSGDHDLIAVPAPSNRWVGICPAGHSVWINDMDRKLNHNLKPFIHMVKAWSYFNKNPIWSYYLELCVADFLKKDASIVYSTDLNNFFKYMLSRRLDPFEATEGCTEPVYGTSIADKPAAMDAIGQAVEFSEQARMWETRGNIHDAYYWWRKMFDWRFAAY